MLENIYLELKRHTNLESLVNEIISIQELFLVYFVNFIFKL
jgi:hypothetical protein